MTAETLFAVAVSPFVGSFIANFVARFPTTRSVLLGRSMCPHCDARLTAIDLVPLLSWLRSMGRCRHCGQKIAAMYPIIELGAVAIAVAAAASTAGWLLWVTCGLGWTLLALAATDLRYFVLPDALTLPLIPAGMAVAYLQDPADLQAHAIGAIAGFMAFMAVRGVYFRLRGREGLGLGDVKLLAAAGAWIAWQSLPGLIVIATVTGLGAALIGRLFGERIDLSDRVPFGAFLCFALWFEWGWGPLYFDGITP
jgi:leader peptidase (prepilin peptidase) / N-methyltransferase